MKSTFVPMTDADENWRALGAAMMVARDFGGHVDVMHVHADVDFDISSSLERLNVAQQVREELLARAKAEVEAEVDRAHEKFKTMAARYEIATHSGSAQDGAATASWQNADGRMSEIVRKNASVYDAVFFAQSAQTRVGDWQHSVESVLFAAGRPVILVPAQTLESIGQTVLIGWNRTTPSARALFAAMPFLRAARRVIIFSVQTDAKEGPPPQAAASLLARHGIAAKVDEVPPGAGPVAELLLSKARDAGADLIVMGAYSHSRFREIVLGGVTRHALRHAQVPVLLAH